MEIAMKHVNRSLAFLLAGALTATGCATAHLRGDYLPGSLPPDKPLEVQNVGEKTTIAEGSTWPLFWGLVEVGSTNLGDDAKKQLRANEVIQDPEVRNHLSLPGALLWIVTLGLVSHHDLDLRGHIGSLKEKEIVPATAAAGMGAAGAGTTVMTDRGRGPAVVINNVAPGGTTTTDGERYAGAAKFPSEKELYAEATIDRPLKEVVSDFNSSAKAAGFTPIADVAWTDLAPSERMGVPENQLAGVPYSDIHTFCVTTPGMASDVKRDAKCGTFLPGIVCYEKDGKTNLVYGKPTEHLRFLDNQGLIGTGEGKIMSREQFDDHYQNAREFEKSCALFVESLKTTSRTP
jgi:hypothetical protein